jgi:hypothetical protein
MARERDFEGIRRHSIIETVVVVFLAVFGHLAEDNPSLKALFGDHTLYRLLAVLFVVGVLALVVFFFLNWFFATRQTKFGTAGKIEGAWLDAIYNEEGRLIMGSFLEMKCSPLEGFYVYGHSYRVTYDNAGGITVEPGPENFFEGNGAPWKFGNGCYYRYQGREHRPDEGHGYYQFYRGFHKKDVTFEGGFASRNLEAGKIISARLVQGKKFRGKKKEYETKEQRMALLKEHLNQCPREFVLAGVNSAQ